MFVTDNDIIYELFWKDMIHTYQLKLREIADKGAMIYIIIRQWHKEIKRCNIIFLSESWLVWRKGIRRM